jgi:UTP-glucose-1-phosphate uridylyltransferase
VLLCSGLDPDTRVCSVEAMIEKPSASQATAGCLAPPEFGLPAGSVLCNFGMDILPQKVFSVLKAQGATPSGEVELRTAQADLLDMVNPRISRTNFPWWCRAHFV